MGNTKYTLNDIRIRKAELARLIEETRNEIRDDVYSLTHPFSRHGKKCAPALPSFRKVVLVVSNIGMVYKVVTKFISIFKKR